MLYDPDQLPAREQLLSYCYIQRPALPAAVAKELCAEPATDPAAAAAVGEGAHAGGASAAARAQHELHVMVGPALAGDGRAIVNRLPPLPHAVVVGDAAGFVLDEDRLQQTAPKSLAAGGAKNKGSDAALGGYAGVCVGGGGVLLAWCCKYVLLRGCQ